MSKTLAERRAEFRARGVCIYAPSHGASYKSGLCKNCYDKNLARNNARYRAHSRSSYSCSRCWEFGHNVRTCTAKRARTR